MVFASLAFMACDSKKEVKEEVVANASVTMKIEGMTCAQGCAAFIENELSESKGIASASVDFETGICQVKFDSTQVKPLEMESKIEGLNNSAYQAEIQESTAQL